MLQLKSLLAELRGARSTTLQSIPQRVFRQMRDCGALELHRGCSDLWLCIAPLCKVAPLHYV